MNWKDSVRIYQTQMRTPDASHPVYDDPNYRAHIAKRAGAELGVTFIRDGIATHEQRKDDIFGAVIDVWKVAVVHQDRVGEFTKQLDEHRVLGMEQAARIVRDMAARYAALDGPCAHVLRSSLNDAAAKIIEAANMRAVG